MVFQSYALFPNMTVSGNIAFGLKVGGSPGSEIKQRVQEMLALIKLEEMGNRYPYQLSGGQQQRVALARALAIRPLLLLLDEPLSALDAKIRVALRGEIRAIQRQLGITTIYVTHDQEEAMSLSDRVVVMNQGLIEQVGAPFEIYNFPTTAFVAGFVGTLNTLDATVIDANTGALDVHGAAVFTTHPLNYLANGSPAKIAVRPELLTPESTGRSNENRLTGTVEAVTFLGAVVRLNVRIGNALLMMDEFNNPQLTIPTIGEEIALYFFRENCMVLDD